jgi:Flp pilus assembly protein TadB
MSGIVCILVLVLLYLGWGWAGVIVGAVVLLVAGVLIARYQVDREDAAALRRVQRPRAALSERIANLAGTDLDGGILPPDTGGIDRTPNHWWKNTWRVQR